MDIMHVCDIIPLQWPRKEKKEKESKQEKDLYI
jgi:hypothetical protein